MMEKTIKNSIIITIAQLITVMLSFMSRKVFVFYMDIEYLGYESLFSNILNILSIAEMGIGNVIVYNLYREIANNNIYEIKKFVNIYKIMYRYVAIIVTVAGLILVPFLPYLVSGELNAEWSYIRYIYYIQLLGIVSSYFMSYRRTIFIADQKEYKCAIYDTIGRVALQVLQIVILAFTQNFILYIWSKVVGNIIINFVVYCKSNSEYPYLKDSFKITLSDIKEKKIIQETKDFIVHKIANAVYVASSNVVISANLGIRMVALYGNYYLLQNTVLQIFLYKILNPLKAAIGNLQYSEKDDSRKKDLFYMFSLIGTIIAIYVSICFLMLYQPFIIIWLGKDYLLQDSFVILTAISIYFQIAGEIIYMYRAAYGDYFYDRKYMVLSAAANLIIAIALVNYIGILAIPVAATVGMFFIILGRVKFVFWKIEYFEIKKYIKSFSWHMIIFAVNIAIACVASSFISADTIAGLIISGIFAVIIPTVVMYISFRNSQEARLLMGYVKRLINKIFKKVK